MVHVSFSIVGQVMMHCFISESRNSLRRLQLLLGVEVIKSKHWP